MYLKILRLVVPLRRDFPLLGVVPWVVFATACPYIGLVSGACVFPLLALLCKGWTLTLVRLGAYLVFGAAVGLSHQPPSVQTQAGLIRIEGTVEVPLRHRRPGLIEFGLRDTSADFDVKGARLWCRAVLLPWRVSNYIRPGYRVMAQAQVKGTESLGRYGEYLRTLGFSASCRVAAIAIIGAKESVASLLRRDIRSRAYRFTGTTESTGMVLAMTLGARDQISQLTEDAFRRTGLTHVLVLSGFQLTLMFGLTFRFCAGCLGWFSFCRRRLNIRAVACFAASFAVLILLVFAGIEHSSSRAGLALLLSSSGMLFERPQKFLNLMLSSLLLLAVLWPGCLGHVGVQLTYAALGGIVLASGRTGVDKSLLGVSFWCSLCTSWVVLYHFHSFSLMGFLVNPLVAPLCSVIGTQWGLISLLSAWCGFGLSLRMQAATLELVTAGVHWLAKHDWTYINLEQAVLPRTVVLSVIAAVVVRRASYRVKTYYRGYGW